ncbi:MAG: ISAs1 family transposase [Chloroflexota bacterium]|nr:ISAs1 family transposase [Chloroflexota bacterium]
MDHPESTTLESVLAQVPDPRKRRGKRHAWTLLWTTICTALLSEQRTPHAIAHWIRLHAEELIARLQPARHQVPSESTVRRALRHIDLTALEQQLTQFSQHLPPPSAPEAPPPPPVPHVPSVPAAPVRLRGLAVDGKAVRGAGMHGPRPHLVSLVEHSSARVLAQRAVVDKRHESSAVGPLLQGHDLVGCVITMDAGLTQRKLATQILAQGGQYLMVVKRNQRQLYDDLALFFQRPPLPCEAPWDVVQTVTKGHGRLETRCLPCTAELDDYLTWPGVQQVLRRECERIVLKTGAVTRSVTYGLTSLAPRAATPAQVEGVWRGHWTIENRTHSVRDVTMGEDAGQASRGSTPQALAALRNALLTLLRWRGWTNIADALRTYAASLAEALKLIGALPAGL